MVKYRLFLLCVLLCLCLTAGCITPTADNPFGIEDPNQVQGWIDFGVQIGQGAAAAGTATGNPYLLAWGAGLVAVGGVLTAILFGKRKKDGESES